MFRLILSILFALLIDIQIVGAKDAAIEIEEGNVNNWIEYYKNERNIPIEKIKEANSAEDSSNAEESTYQQQENKQN
ncbi:MAG: hypothetical protein VW437_07090 [Betaproteobacteria bacterium]